MSAYNRSFRGGSFLGGFMAGAPVIRGMLYANVGVYLFQLFFGSLHVGAISVNYIIERYGALWPIGSGYFFFLQPITYMFLHGGFTHLLFNMIALIIFGPALEMTWGSQKTLVYYTLCGLGGGAAHILISPFIGAGAGPLVGASGAIFGLLVAFGMMFPNQVLLLSLIFPMKAKYAVLMYIAIEVFSIQAGDGVSHLAHLGGAVVGIVYLLIDGGGRGVRIFRSKNSSSQQAERWQNSQQNPFNRRRSVNDDDQMFDAEYEEIGSRSNRNATASAATMSRVITQEDIDKILDKIAASGYQNLTEEEREILFEASRKMEGHR